MFNFWDMTREEFRFLMTTLVKSNTSSAYFRKRMFRLEGNEKFYYKLRYHAYTYDSTKALQSVRYCWHNL